MRFLANWSGILACLMIIIVGGLIPAGLMSPEFSTPPRVFSIPSTWQVPAVLLSSVVCGPKSGVIATIAYLTIGLFFIPVFHGGGGEISYLANPSTCYLFSFVPTAWFTGEIIQKFKYKTIFILSLSAFFGLILLHISGSISIVIGSSLGLWNDGLLNLLYRYTIAPFPAQAILCPAIGIIGFILRSILFLK